MSKHHAPRSAHEPKPHDETEGSRPGAGAAPARTVSLSEAEYATLRQQATQADTYLEQARRIAADFENAKKRLERERTEMTEWANERLIRGLIPIVDSFDRAMQHCRELDANHPLVVGMTLIHRQLTELLSKEGFERIKTVGEQFDPHQHEAIGEVETDAHDGPIIVEEIQTGFRLHGRLLRPALVKIAKARGQKTEDRSQKSEERDQKSEDRSQTTEDRKQKTGTRDEPGSDH